jgi:hypothetical protein
MAPGASSADRALIEGNIMLFSTAGVNFNRSRCNRPSYSDKFL